MKKILIITYYWPPAGGPGVQRWLKFTKYLPLLGIKPYVYIPENPSYPYLDASLEKEVNPEIILIKKKIFEPYSFIEFFSKKNKNFKGGTLPHKKNKSFLDSIIFFIRGNFFIPDARKFWIKPSIKYLSEYIKKENIDTIITTGPPHSLHLIGLGLKKNYNNIKWIADFRDPWTRISYHKNLYLTYFAKQKHVSLEKKVLSTSDLVLSTSFTDGEYFQKNGAKNIEIITNGFDEEDLKKIDSTIKTQNSKFSIVHVGTLNYLQNPKNLWKAIQELMIENKIFSDDILIKMIGKTNNEIENTIEEFGLKKCYENMGYRSHSESLLEMNRAHILFLVNFNTEDAHGVIPGKIFEYLMTHNPIVSIGPAKADVEKILENTGGGKHFAFHQKEEIKDYILMLYNNFKDGIPLSTNNIEQYGRKKLTERLAQKIYEL